MKKICFLVDSVFTIGGVQRVTAVIAKALSADHDVTIVTFDSPSLKDTSIYGLRDARIAYRFFAYPRVGAFETLVCKAYSAFYRYMRPRWQWSSNLYALSSFPRPLRRSLANELRCGHYDTIVGVHAPLAARLATVRPMLGNGVRCIGWIHNSFDALFSPASLYIGPQLKRHYMLQMRKLDCTVVLSQNDAKKWQDGERDVKPGSNVIVIHNPLTLTPGPVSAGRSKRFLAVGRMSRMHKGFDLLIDAFNIFAKSDDEWKLDIVGEGTEEQMLREKIAGYGLQQRIALHHFTNNIQEYYSQAQVYVLSSRWEGFGLVLVEAMAHGLPVVSSDLPTSREIMGDAALYFPTGDAEALARQLQAATRLDWHIKSAESLSIARRFSADCIIGQWNVIID